MSAYFTKENITLLISILGACAWIPTVIELLKIPKLDCKVLSYDWLENGCLVYYLPFDDGLQKEHKGIVFAMRIRIISRNNDFSISNVKAKVKYNSMSNEMDAFIHYSPTFTVNNLNKTLHFPKNDNIVFCPVLRKNETYDLDAHLVVESIKHDVEYMKFIFINTKGKQKIVLLKKEDFKNATKIFI